LRTEVCESTSLVRFERIRCDKYKCYFCDWIRSLCLDIIVTLEIIILYLISHVYQVHTAAETSPSPAHATVYHGQSAKCWKLESTYLCGNDSEPMILWISSLSYILQISEKLFVGFSFFKNVARWSQIILLWCNL